MRAAAVHGAPANNVDEFNMRKPMKLEAIRLPTPKKGKKKNRQQTWDNIDDYWRGQLIVAVRLALCSLYL